MSRSRIRTTNRDRLQAQAREQTQRLRQELDALADPETFAVAPAPGLALSPPDHDDFDEADGDNHLRDGDGEDSPEPGEESPAPTSTPLRRLLGTQPPVALVHLALDEDDLLRAHLLVAPRATVREALVEIVALTEDTFQRGRGLLTDPEWRTLLGLDPATPTVRLLLLVRIAITGAERIRLGESATFQPNNRGLERYAGKLALLPDGLPFSLRLLLKPQRKARRSPDEDRANHPFGLLPESVKLLALRRALALEAAEGTARMDDDFRFLIGQALAELGLDVPAPTWKHVEMLRSNLTRRGLPDVFPNARTRQRQYDVSRQPAAHPGSEESDAPLF